MTTYKIFISDRTRGKRISIDHESGERIDQALAEAIGQRCYGLPRLDSHSGDGLTATYQATVTIGRARDGSTPVKSVWVYVYAEGV